MFRKGREKKGGQGSGGVRKRTEGEEQLKLEDLVFSSLSSKETLRESIAVR